MSRRAKLPYRRALVTGARTGLGLAVADALRSAGLEVRGTARPENAVAKGLIPADLSTPEGCRNFLRVNPETVRRTDLWVFNAGAASLAYFPSKSEEVILRQWFLMCAGPILMCREIWPHLTRHSPCAIVFVSSLAARLPIPAMSVYAAAKAGISQFANTLMLENHTGNPIIVDWQPGDLKTGFNAHLLAEDRDNEAIRRLRTILDARLDAAPMADRAAADLIRVLARGRSQRFSSGGFFQTRMATLADRLLPRSVMCWMTRRYFGIK